MGIRAGRSQKLIQELLESYENSNETLEKIYEKFSRAEKLTKEDHAVKESLLVDNPNDDKNNPASG